MVDLHIARRERNRNVASLRMMEEQTKSSASARVGALGSRLTTEMARNSRAYCRSTITRVYKAGTGGEKQYRAAGAGMGRTGRRRHGWSGPSAKERCKRAMSIDWASVSREEEWEQPEQVI